MGVELTVACTYSLPDPLLCGLSIGQLSPEPVHLAGAFAVYLSRLVHFLCQCFRLAFCRLELLRQYAVFIFETFDTGSAAPHLSLVEFEFSPEPAHLAVGFLYGVIERACLCRESYLRFIFRHIPSLSFPVTFPFDDIVCPGVICDLVLHDAQQERYVSVPEYVLRDLEYEDVIDVVVFYILKLELRRFYSLLPGPCFSSERFTEA